MVSLPGFVGSPRGPVAVGRFAVLPTSSLSSSPSSSLSPLPLPFLSHPRPTCRTTQERVHTLQLPAIARDKPCPRRGRGQVSCGPCSVIHGFVEIDKPVARRSPWSPPRERGSSRLLRSRRETGCEVLTAVPQVAGRFLTSGRRAAGVQACCGSGNVAKDLHAGTSAHTITCVVYNPLPKQGGPNGPSAQANAGRAGGKMDIATPVLPWH